jgi:hypothetical protein
LPCIAGGQNGAHASWRRFRASFVMSVHLIANPETGPLLPSGGSPLLGNKRIVAQECSQGWNRRRSE